MKFCRIRKNLLVELSGYDYGLIVHFQSKIFENKYESLSITWLCF